MSRPLEDSATFVHVLSRRGHESPEQVAFTHLVDGEREEWTVTYGDLHRRSCRIAVELRERCRVGDRILMLYPAGPEFVEAFFGCLYAGMIAVPAYPPDPGRLDRTIPRLRAIADDADVPLVLTTIHLHGIRDKVNAIDDRLGGLPWLATGALGEPSDPVAFQNDVKLEDLAFVQYTSGSKR